MKQHGDSCCHCPFTVNHMDVIPIKWIKDFGQLYNGFVYRTNFNQSPIFPLNSHTLVNISMPLQEFPAISFRHWPRWIQGKMHTAQFVGPKLRSWNSSSTFITWFSMAHRLKSQFGTKSLLLLEAIWIRMMKVGNFMLIIAPNQQSDLPEWLWRQYNTIKPLFFFITTYFHIMIHHRMVFQPALQAKCLKQPISIKRKPSWVKKEKVHLKNSTVKLFKCCLGFPDKMFFCRLMKLNNV